ncbi:Atrial natriuretic peptide clearance receptor [Plakobranchus ocellatus]|uniref:Atrial natriuretic peptide clearance receptor n=1 Tax=Plakobranchus ocellatus TaxID=259542 RepID=A0AAV4A3N1_9GAST|nr:Atrial natriuretic peptide clearance receptor [Plakobranchus ocellatus]
MTVKSPLSVHLLCSSLLACLGSLTASSAFIAGQVHAFLGPVCDYSASPVARQAKYWNIPLITSGAMASDYLLRRSTLYTTLTRVGPNYDTFIAFIATVCDQFHFSKVFLVYDPEGQNNVLDKLCHVVTDGLHKAFGGNPNSKYNISSDYAKLVKTSDIQHILEDRVGADFAGERNLNKLQ